MVNTFDKRWPFVDSQTRNLRINQDFCNGDSAAVLLNNLTVIRDIYILHTDICISMRDIFISNADAFI